MGKIILHLSKDGKIWFNDGITTGGKSIEEGCLSTMTDKTRDDHKYGKPMGFLGMGLAGVGTGDYI